MKRRFTIPKFSSKDFPILVGSMLPMAMIINYILFGNQYFGSSVFVIATLVTFLVLAVCFLFYGFIAISLRNRFPLETQATKRLTICISLFILLSSVVISIILRSYDFFGFFSYDYKDSDFIKCYFTFLVVNVFLTFLNEGVSRFEKYKATVQETEELKKEYMHSQLLGLKSQMNPHFLFNGLNTLSSLINEDPEKAETFLDHMSKVYRYLLRNNEEQLVSLDTELNFLKSYNYLLKARYADAFDLSISAPPENEDKMIPPLTLQMLVENALNENTMGKETPLIIQLNVGDTQIEVINNVQPKVNLEQDAESLENIANKFRLLAQQEIKITQTGRQRIIQMPVLHHKIGRA